MTYREVLESILQHTQIAVDATSKGHPARMAVALREDDPFQILKVGLEAGLAREHDGASWEPTAKEVLRHVGPLKYMQAAMWIAGTAADDLAHCLVQAAREKNPAKVYMVADFITYGIREEAISTRLRNIQEKKGDGNG